LPLSSITFSFQVFRENLADDRKILIGVHIPLAMAIPMPNIVSR